MDDFDLEKLAIREIIEEIERNKEKDLNTSPSIQRRSRPNKRFLGRTIVSVLQHNRRQYTLEKQKSYRKLKELDNERHNLKKTTERNRSKDRRQPYKEIRSTIPEHYQHIDSQHDHCYEYYNIAPFFYQPPVNLAMCLMNGVGKSPESKKQKKAKRKSILTIDLTKKTKHTKKKKRKSLKKITPKKHRKRDESISSHSNINSASPSSSSSRASPRRKGHPTTLLIDLT